MPKILITGNGFDLFHHLPTKYGHFMAIMETIEKYDFKKEVAFEDLFERFFKERFPEDYNSIKKNYRTENIVFEREKTLEISKLLITNSWYKHFKNVNEIDTWIDFELEIENTLNDISLIFDFSKKYPNRYESYDIPTIKVFKDYRNINLIRSYEYPEAFINNSYLDQNNKKIKESEFLNYLAKSLEDFIIIFNRYLIDIVNYFYDLKKVNLEIPFNLLNEIYTVNYTNTIERIYKIDKQKITYLHGEINENNNLQNLVLGINKIQKIIKTNKIFNFTKSYQKIKKITNNKFIHLPENEIMAENYIFYIIGHSLDKSDDNYILDLFEFLKIDTVNNSEIIIFYYNEDDYNSKLNNLFSIIDEKILIKFNKDKRVRFVELNHKNILLEFNKSLYNRYS